MLEYRTRLLADVVTGQLGARATAAVLPDEREDEAVEAGKVEVEDLDLDSLAITEDAHA